MIKSILLSGIIGILLITSGCSPRTAQGADGQHNDKPDIKKPGISDIRPGTLGGVSLGDSPEEVVKILDKDYEEAVEEDISGYFGEDLIVWNFNNGMTVRFGKESNKVIRVTSKSADSQTDLGIKAGDTIESMHERYSPVFNQVVSRHTGEALTGWYDIGDDRIIIFDFDIDDNTRVNNSEDAYSHVQEIVLAYWKHFD